MTLERRAFNQLPVDLRTEQNDRDYNITDDILYEPEQAEFITGYIGNVDRLTEQDLKRNPQLKDGSDLRQKYQLTIGATRVDGGTQQRISGAFYTDLVRQIAANGGIVDDPNRLFGVAYYAWTPPIDYDKHINYNRYFWMGEGVSDVNGEYLTKEAAGSQTVLYVYDGNRIEKKNVVIVNGLPNTGTDGELIEDASTTHRNIYAWDGSAWALVEFSVVDDVPIVTEDTKKGAVFYVTRVGHDKNRPLIWRYSDFAGRWISSNVVVSSIPPALPTTGMVWEDAMVVPSRIFRVYTEQGSWLPISFTVKDTNVGTAGIDNEYLYDIRPINQLSDGWVSSNFWYHLNDLSPKDQQKINRTYQAIRPIIEFWNGIEINPDDIKTGINQAPQFHKYAIDPTSFEIVDANEATTIFQYEAGTGDDDAVLAFPISHNSSGEILFDLTLESDESSYEGYKYFKDLNTGLFHSVWSKAFEKTKQEMDEIGLYDLPDTLISNPDHEVLTSISRSRMLIHFAGIISSQPTFDGDAFGMNNWRWSHKIPTIGATLIDAEQTLLRQLAILQDKKLDLPDAIRSMARETNKILFRFNNKLNQNWDNNVISTASDELTVTPAEAVDNILTALFVGRNNTFPYFYSSMGTFVQTQIVSGVVSIIDSSPQPIYIPPSPSRVGASVTYVPTRFMDIDGGFKLRGHDGVTIDSYGDDRDLVWLELQNRFYAAVPTPYKFEGADKSSRFLDANFRLKDYYGNFIPNTSLAPVDMVVDNYDDLVSPSPEMLVYSKHQAQFAVYSGSGWITSQAQVDDIFLNRDDSKYYIFNGVGTHPIELFNVNYPFDYSGNEQKRIIRREYDRWAIDNGIDVSENSTFDPNNRFTWNYRSAGTEGHYFGLYSRLYHSIRPHSHPWEVVGYAEEPSWWRNEYVPDSISPDGTPRYGTGHSMWTNFQAGLVHPLMNLIRLDYKMVAPIPVGQDGELLDPIEAGIVDESKLDKLRIDDIWIFGDGAPNEQAFVDSPFHPFAVALAGYLMKPGIWIDTLWSELYLDTSIVSGNLVFNGPHVVHRDTRTRPAMRELPTHLSRNEDGDKAARLGVNAWIAEEVELKGGNADTDFTALLQETGAALAWKCAGFINKNRTIVSTLASKEIPYEDVHTMLHQSYPIEEKFCSGMMVTRENSGYVVFGYDSHSPYFTIETPVIPVVLGQAELRESFVAEQDQHVFVVTNPSFSLPSNVEDSNTAKFSVILNGSRQKPKYIRYLDNKTFQIDYALAINEGDEVVVSTITAQSATSTRTKQFTIGGVAFAYHAKGSGNYENVEYGRFFNNAEDVIDFMVAYGRYLETEGWIFDTIDVEAEKEISDWLTGAKLFAAWVMDTSDVMNPNRTTPIDQLDVFTFSPISERAHLVLPFGSTLNVESVQNGAFGIVDVDYNPIPPEETFTSRVSDKLIVDSISGTQIYGIRVFLTEIQHVVFFSNTTRFNDIIYDPPTALYHRTLRVDSYRSENWKGRFEAAGAMIQSDTLLPNFEKQAYDITRFYDRIDPVDDPEKRNQARNLYGWTPVPENKYHSVVGTDDRSRFDYYRGMIQTKGTIRPMQAFARGTILGSENVFIYEDWAWKIQSFGDTRKEVLQFIINEYESKTEHQVIRFTETTNERDEIIEIHNFDREAPDANPQWIMPPIYTKDSTGNVDIPVGVDGIPDVASVRFYLKLFDNDTGLNILQNFHYDPELNKYHNETISDIETIQPIDPARYNNGDKVVTSNELAWSDDYVGELWWDTTRRVHVKYRSLIPNYTKAASEWGKLKYFRANLSRIDEIATIEFLDPFGTGDVMEHGLVDGDRVSITGANDELWNSEDIAITVTSPTTVEYQINANATNPATGSIKIIVGVIDLYEWVKSPVPPSQYRTHVASSGKAVAGIPLDESDASYTTVITSESNSRKEITTYYFWVKNNEINNGRKPKTTAEYAKRLESPTKMGIPWFAPIDKDSLVVFFSGTPIQDNYGVELIFDKRNQESHFEWQLLSENDQFNTVPSMILSKIIDSLSGLDIFENSVPSPRLSEYEKYGTSVLPRQTIFADSPVALDAFITAANSVFNSISLDSFEAIDIVFPLTEELSDTNPNGWFQRSEYRWEEYTDAVIYDIVGTETVRDSRAANNLYVENDIIRVEFSSSVDPFDGSQVASTHRYTGSSFEEVGVDNYTVAINKNIANDPIAFRKRYYDLLDILDNSQQNYITFVLLYEMQRQSIDCDWFMKTSYISTQIFDVIHRSPFVRPNEVNAIIDNILDVKPYRTKLRQDSATYTVSDAEPVNVNIEAFPNKKISLIYDRLSCNLFDDGAWDGPAWDLARWDKALWTLEDLGRLEFYTVGTLVGDSTTTDFILESPYSPMLYDHRLTFFAKGEEIDADDFNIEYSIITNGTKILIHFGKPLIGAISALVEQSMGFVQGSEPTLGKTLEDGMFRPIESSYKHFAARTLIPNDNNPVLKQYGCADIEDPLGGRPEERIVNEVVDSVNICVKTDYTPLYGSWDGAPWDINPWDQPPLDVGSRVLFMSIGNRNVVPAGLVDFQTSELQSVVAENMPFIVAQQQNPTIVEVQHKRITDVTYTTLSEGLEYKYLNDVSGIEILEPSIIEYAADGISTTFPAPTATRGIGSVYRNKTKQVDGVDYDIVGSNVVFIQPAPSIIDNSATTVGTSYISNGATLTYNTNGIPNHKSHVFVFDDDLLIQDSMYTVDDHNVILNNPPTADSVIAMWTLTNNVGDTTQAFTNDEFVADGTTRSYPIAGNPLSENIFVFIQGKYQILGTDYRVLAGAVIRFASTVPAGNLITIRSIPDSFPVDSEHLVIETSGTAIDVLTGISDATPNNMMVFLDDKIQNMYSSDVLPPFMIVNGNPDKLQWTGTPPPSGIKLSIRVIRNVHISQTVVINVVPFPDDIIRIIPLPYVIGGDAVRLVFNHWDIEPLGTYNVEYAPTTYDITPQGIFSLDSPVIDDKFTIDYHEDRWGLDNREIFSRIPIIVADIQKDHNIYDAPLGFNTNRKSGTSILNTTDNTIYTWDGAQWVDGDVIVAGDTFFVARKQELWKYDGSVYFVIFRLGDFNRPTPPLISFPLWGRGVTSSTYSLGQQPISPLHQRDAALDSPEAYQIMQFDGECR